RQDTEEPDAVVGEAALQDRGDPRLRPHGHLFCDWAGGPRAAARHRVGGAGRAAPWPAKGEGSRTISSIGRPTPPPLTMIAGAPSIRATTAFDRPMTAPTPAWPVHSMMRVSWVVRDASGAATMRATRSSTTSPAMYFFVNPRGMWTG